MKPSYRYLSLVNILLFFGVLMIHGVIESANADQTGRSSSVKSKAYAGHDHDKDKDMTSVMSVHPELAGSRLDDCRLCHTDGEWKGVYENNCDFCHVTYPTEGFETSLNPYGKAYRDAGRSREAIIAIAQMDSDGDGVSNSDEISQLTEPGNKNSNPDLKPAPYVILTPEKLNKIKSHSQFLLLNAPRASDVYATYSGWQMYDLMAAVGALGKVKDITVISLDGFRKDYSGKEIYEPFPRTVFYGDMDNPAFLGECTPWVIYPEKLPVGVESGKEIPGEQRLILANKKNGQPLEPLSRNTKEKLTGEGPYRTIMPLRRNAPPDQPMKTSKPECPNPFNENLHHNSSDCARGVIAIAVHPFPEGTKEPDWQSRADELLQSDSIMVFGAIEVEAPKKNRLVLR